MPTHVADLANGKLMFTIGGCINCHRPGKDQTAANPDLPSGGSPLRTPIGTLYPPNLTPDPETGLGRWTRFDFLDATMRGVSPAGTNYIPAFPYTSYAAMKPGDLLDIQAYLQSLPAVKSPPKKTRDPAHADGASRRRIVETVRAGYAAVATGSDPPSKLESRILSGCGPGSLRRVPHPPQHIPDETE